MLHGRAIVAISTIDWGFIWQGPQEIMARLGREGNRVTYVENLGARTPGIKDASRVMVRLRNWSRSHARPWDVSPGVRIVSPLILPFPYHSVARRINRQILRRTVVAPLLESGGGRPIVWIFLPSPVALDVAEMLHPAVLVYHCVDNYGATSSGAKAIERSERELLRRADLVFATSAALQTYAERYRPVAHRFPMGVDFDLFRSGASEPPPADVAAIPRPRAVYVGGLRRYVDFDLIDELARRMPDTHFCLIGPRQTPEVDRLGGRPNIHMLGVRPHGALPAYIASCDVAIAPYRVMPYTMSVYPQKLTEYLATGKPVVATPLPDLVEFERTSPGTLELAFGADAFEAAIRRALSQDDEAARSRRITAARQNDWTARLHEMSDLIEMKLEGSEGSER